MKKFKKVSLILALSAFAFFISVLPILPQPMVSWAG